MNGLRRIPRIFAKVTAAFAVVVAIAVPASLMSTGVAGAATAPTLSTSSNVNYANDSTGYAIIGQGFAGPGLVYFTGSGFANDQGTGGQVSITTTATGATFSNVTEISGTEAYATLTTTSATPPGFYPVTLTDDNGSGTLAIGLGVDTGPQITTISGNTGEVGGGASTITITGQNLIGVTPSFLAPNGCNPLGGGTITQISNSDLSEVFRESNTGASACTYTLVLTSPYPSEAPGSTVASYVVNPVTTPISITGISPSELSITGLSAGSPTSTSTVTITGTGFEPGAVGQLSAWADVSGGFTYVNSTTMSGQITLTFGVIATDLNVTITNPDATFATGTGILGIGMAPSAVPVSTPAPTVGCALINPDQDLQAGLQTVFDCTGSSTFPITVNTTFELSLPGYTLPSEMVKGTVLSVTNNVALVNANIPYFSETTTNGNALVGATSLSVASTAGIPSSGPLTIVDGTSTETVTISGVPGATTIPVSATAFAHASGVVVEWPFKTAVGPLPVGNGENYTVTANNTANTATSFILVQNPATPTYNGAPAGSLFFNPGTYAINATVPGFGFTTGASITFLGGSGSTGTVTPVNMSNATLNINVPATISEPGVTLTSPAAPGQDQATLTGATVAPTPGESLTVGPNPTDATKTTQTLVVASYSAPIVTFTTNFSQTYNTGDAVTGITEPQPIAPLEAVLTNGSGEAVLINPLLTTSAVGTATLTQVGSGAYVNASGALGDGAGAGGGPSWHFLTNAPLTGGYPVVFTTTGPALGGPAGYTITSTTPGVTFAQASVTSANTIRAYATVASSVAASTTVPVTITNGLASYTGTITVDSTVPTVSGVTAVGTLGPSNTSETIGVYGTNFNTSDPASNDFCYTTTPGLTCTIYDNGDTPPGGGVVTTDTATTLTVVLTTSWYFANEPSSNAPEPFPTNGNYGIVIGQKSDGGSGVFTPAVTVAGEPTVTSVSPNPVDASTPVGTLAVTGVGFIGSGSIACEVMHAGVGSTTYSYSGSCTATVNSATSVTINSSSSYGPGSLVFEIGDGHSTWTVDTPAVQVITSPVPTLFWFNNDPSPSMVFYVVAGSTNAPFRLIGSGFLPGSTLSLPAADGTITATLVTPNAIFGTVTVPDTLGGTYTVTVTNANGTTKTVPLYVQDAPYVNHINGTSTSSVLEGTATKLVLTGNNFVAGATVALTNPALGTFGTAVVSDSGSPTDTCTSYLDDCDTLTVTLTPLTFEGGTPIGTGLVVTNPVGDGSWKDANSLTINPVPVVTGSYFVPTFSSNLEVTINGNGFQAGMVVTATNSPAYTVLLVSINAAGTSAVLLVSATSAATTGTSSTVTFTNPDGGAVSFPLNGGPAPTPNLHVTGIGGRPAHIGKSVTFTITGSSLAASTVTVSGHKGVSVHKLSNSSTVIKVKVTVKKGTSVGKALLHVTNSGGTATLAFSIKK